MSRLGKFRSPGDHSGTGDGTYGKSLAMLRPRLSFPHR
jgi:hypothetical protein